MLVNLPDDVVLAIIHYLDYPCIVSLERTCRHLCSIMERHGWNIFLRRTDYYFPSLTLSINSKCWSSSHLIHHLVLAEQAWHKRRFVTRQLGPDWNTNFHPILALHSHRLIVGTGNSLICYKFKPPPSISETTRVSFERVIAFPKDARKDIVGMGFYNNGNDVILAFVHGGLGRVKLLDGASPTKRISINLPSLALVKNITSPRIKNLSICGDTALTVDSSGSLSLFSLKHPRPEIISTTNPFVSGHDKPVVAWSNYLSLTSSAGYTAVGVSSSTVSLSIYPISESTIFNRATAHLSPLASEDNFIPSTAVYAITGGNSNSLDMTQSHSYSDQIVLSGWFHGVVSMHDLRCPSRIIGGNNKMLSPVLLLRDPLALSAIYSLSIADYRVTAGSAQHGLLQLYDIRAPRSGFSIYLPTPRGASSPVYSTIMESTRVWAAAASSAHVIDFGRTSHNTFPVVPNRRGEIPCIKAPMYEHSDHYLSSLT